MRNPIAKLILNNGRKIVLELRPDYAYNEVCSFISAIRHGYYDNFAIQRIVPGSWIDASYNGPIINCCIYDPKVTGCYRCIRESNLRNMTRLGYEEAHTDKVPEINAAISPIVLISGSLAAYEGIRYLAKLKPQSLGKAIHQNMFDYSNSYTVEIPHECQHRATQE